MFRSFISKTKKGAGLPCATRATRAFTIVELIVSIAIFAMMTALVVVKYGSFNNSVLLTNAAYDIAGVIRTAQTYGLSVKNDSSNQYSKIYGVNFNIGYDSGNVCNVEDPTSFVMYTNEISSDSSSSETEYTCADSNTLSTYILKNGARISDIIVYIGEYDFSMSNVSITFKRPDPDAIFLSLVSLIECTNNPQVQTYFCNTGNLSIPTQARLVITSADGSDHRYINIYKNGQISVGDI